MAMYYYYHHFVDEETEVLAPMSKFMQGRTLSEILKLPATCLPILPLCKVTLQEESWNKIVFKS